MVQVLLSTYNGEKFLKEQMDSIINQSYKDIKILIRDDGSSDDTLNIIRHYADKYENIEYVLGNNVGVVASYFKLILDSDPACDYFSFCDQDDFWLEDKVLNSVKKLEGFDNSPAMCFTGYKITDESLNTIGHSKNPSFIGIENAIVQNIVTGCTLTINKKMIELCKSRFPDTNKVYMHDSWFYLLGCSFGKIVYDEGSSVLYRQHSKNVIGATSGFFEKTKANIRYVLDSKTRKLYRTQIEEFYSLFGNDILQKQLFEQFLLLKGGIFNRLKVGISMPFCFQTKKTRFKYQILFILGLV